MNNDNTAISQGKVIGGLFGALLVTIINEVLPGACLIAGALLVIHKKSFLYGCGFKSQMPIHALLNCLTYY